MEKIWLRNYAPGVPAEINADAYSSIVELFKEACEKFADRAAFDNFGTQITYKRYYELSQQFASYLQNTLGHQRGDRVAIMLPNILQYPVALLGILLAGCTIVNVNPLYTARELEHQLSDSGATTIIVMENFAKTLEQCLANTPIKNVVVTQLADLFPTPKRQLFNFVVKHVKKLVPPWKIAGAVPFNRALEMGAMQTLTPVQLTGEDLAFLQYTGGTTGVAKGAELTHRNIIANVLQVKAWTSSLFNLDKPFVTIAALPLYHIFALTANLLAMVPYGATNVLITNPRDISLFIKLIKNRKFVLITGVNTLFNALVHHPRFKEVDTSQLVCALGGGAAVQRAVADKWHEATRHVLSEGYGLTECCPLVCLNRLDATAFTGSVGFPAPSTEISIRDEAGNELPLGAEGELCVRGPQVMRGYWRRPEETAKVFFADGWLRTGDFAKVDEEGRVYLLERKKDMIIVSGFNVYPNEIEDVLAKHPKIQEVAVVGMPSEKTGEQVKAVIVPKDSSLTAEEVITYARTQLTGYKVPKVIEFRTELPKSAVGKVLRRELR